SLADTKPQDRIVLWYGATEADPATSISIVFSEPLSRPASDSPTESDDAITPFFRERIRVDRVNGESSVDVTNEMQFRIDSSDRRISIHPRSSLVRGATYRITMKSSITDKAGKQLLSVSAPGSTSFSGREVSFEIRVSGPQGVLGEFDVTPSPAHPSSAIRDLARGKSLVFVSAMEGGLVAYDLNDSSLLAPSDEQKPEPVAFVPGAWSNDDGERITTGLDQHWAVATDNHGRVFSTGFFSNFGVVRSYREEDFREASSTNMCAEQPAAPAHALCRHVGAAILSWRPGYASTLPIGSDIISDRPEAYARKLQIVADDIATEPLTRDAFKDGYGAAIVRAFSNGAEQLRLIVPFDRTNAYQVQRITVENSTRMQSWSADAEPNSPAVFDRILAMPGDMLRIIRNQQTFGVVTLFGYGVGVYDLNAIESNDAPQKIEGYEPLREQVALTDGTLAGLCVAASKDAAIESVSLAPDAVLQQTAYRTLTAFTLEVRRGLLDLSVTLPNEEQSTPLCVRRSDGLVLFNPAKGTSPNSRLNAIVQKYVENGIPINARFQSIAPFSWRISAAENTLGERGAPRGSDARRDYALVAAGDLGLLVVETYSKPSHPLTAPGALSAGNLADVIWVPSGAVAVRAIQSEALALVIDGDGRLLLVDISRIDERMRPDGGRFGDSLLFPTATEAIAGGAIAGRIGRDDPRIIWKSEPGLVSGTLPPLYDPISGVAFLGQLLTKTMAVASLVDPRMQILGQDSSGRLVPIDAIAPLGMAAAPGATPAFRIGLQLPRSAERALGSRLNVAIESERVAGALAGHTPPHWPLSHLRLTAGDAAEEASLQRAITLASDITNDLTPEESAALLALQEDQTTAGRLLSPWIVAVADPRASIRYAPHASLADEGCVNCGRPANLAGRGENEGVFELWSSSLVRVRPECSTATPCANPLAGTPYAQLAASGRLQARIASAPADTVRPRGTEVAAVLPPVADGAFQDTIYLHSGEVET
ncbi:MAG: Ig-like domain-containing domain, partial [Thermoanaerobaculia bacterium]